MTKYYTKKKLKNFKYYKIIQRLNLMVSYPLKIAKNDKLIMTIKDEEHRNENFSC